MRLPFSFILLLIAADLLAGEQYPTIHHTISAHITPDKGEIEVVDRITLPKPAGTFSFLLHGHLTIAETSENRQLAQRSISAAIPLKRYTLTFTNPTASFTLKYRGTITHGLHARSDGYTEGRATTRGSISTDGVFLAGGSYWYPRTIQDSLITFDLTTSLPQGWHSVSQGETITSNQWREYQPQDDIYLIAAPFHIYSKETATATAQVYLRSTDDTLANRYLDTTEHYLELYSNLIGEYPYSKFALVENFWESGYGMPSFTLLGPRIIRFPFILHSSYPHEILHNWWGNSVYIDYQSGNWAEGLTSYLADHLIKEQQKKGAEYRRDSLQKYADYVSSSEDFPLIEFRANHGDTSQAIGYSKTLLMFHMLRKKLGDEAFIGGLRTLYNDQRFKITSYRDLRRAFESGSGINLERFFDQWTKREGAPSLELEAVRVNQQGNFYQLSGKIKQTQKHKAFELDIPVFVHLDDNNKIVEKHLSMNTKELDFNIDLPSEPTKLSIDPRFELFRSLNSAEIPASFGKLFGADNPTVVLPSEENNIMKTAYKKLADSWKQRNKRITIVWDSELKNTPDGKVWLFGKQNKFIRSLGATLLSNRVELTYDDISWSNKRFESDQHSVAIALKLTNSDTHERHLGVVIAPTPAALASTARKLPHYSRYSYTIFSGDASQNVLKGQWNATQSPLIISLSDKNSTSATVPNLSPLTSILSK